MALSMLALRLSLENLAAKQVCLRSRIACEGLNRRSTHDAARQQRIRTLAYTPPSPSNGTPSRRPPPPPKDEKMQTFVLRSDTPRPAFSSSLGTRLGPKDEGIGARHNDVSIKKPISREQMVLEAIDRKNQKRTSGKALDSKQAPKLPPVEKLVEKYRVNAEIVGVAEAVLVAPSGSMGKLPFAKIQEEATKAKLDMVEVATQPEVVIRLMDFNAFVEEKKQARKQREALMGTQPKDLEEPLLPLKEIQIGTNIEHHDFELKKDVMRKFLDKKHPVKLVIKMKRSKGFKNESGPQKANELINRVLSDLSDVLALEKTKHDPKPAPGSVVKFFYPKTVSISSGKGASPTKQDAPSSLAAKSSPSTASATSTNMSAGGVSIPPSAAAKPTGSTHRMTQTK